MLQTSKGDLNSKIFFFTIFLVVCDTFYPGKLKSSRGIVKKL